MLEEGVLEKYYFEGRCTMGLPGSIRLGRLSKVVPGIRASTVNIGPRKNGLLDASDIIGPARVYVDGVGEECKEATTAQQPSKNKINESVHNSDNVVVSPSREYVQKPAERRYDRIIGQTKR